MLAEYSHQQHVVTGNDNIICLAVSKVDRKRRTIEQYLPQVRKPLTTEETGNTQHG